MAGSFSNNVVRVRLLDSGQVAVFRIDDQEEQEYFVGDILLLSQEWHSASQAQVLGMGNRSMSELDRLNTLYITAIDTSNRTINKPKSGGSNMNVSKSLNTSKVVEAAKATIKQSKDIAITVQKGKAVLTALETLINELPLVPQAVKDIIGNEKYGDLILGMLINTAALTFSDNQTIVKAAKSANFVGSFTFASEFTMVEEFIENSLTKVLAPLNLVEKVMTEEE